MSLHPEIKLAHREDKVYITVVLADTKDAKVNLAPEGVFSFSATAGQHAFGLKLELADKVIVACSRHPEIKWAQREDKVYITVVLADTKDAKVNLAPEGVFSFSATAGQHAYNLKLQLADKVNLHESKINIGERSIFCILEKAEPKWWNKLLKGVPKTPHYVKVDWDKWVDEDDEDANLDVGGLDFSKFGYIDRMGGMGGDDEDSDDEDSDDEGQEVETKTGPTMEEALEQKTD